MVSDWPAIPGVVERGRLGIRAVHVKDIIAIAEEMRALYGEDAAALADRLMRERMRVADADGAAQWSRVAKAVRALNSADDVASGKAVMPDLPADA